ncbi:MAG: V-type ATPase subunit [Nanoarchaeota archaeon]|nr:V-type ATPase subunit [Nanoarchaeota archaeon]MBU1005125.1 V-type ATPase subunit [Nanoarchaeota archaeon]MBU1946973.1 V-type ATPase subunit [Nanoarchaeota archaeon]
MVNETLVNITSMIVNGTNSSTVDGASKLGLFKGIFNPSIITFVVPFAFVGVVLVFAIKRVMPMSKFLYANSRIQARSNYMVSEKLVKELAEAKSLNEFISLLKETEYGYEIEKSKADLKSIHIALEKGFIDSVLEMVAFSPKKSKPLFNAYLMFFEVKILKSVYRARLLGIELKEEMTYPIGIIDDTLLKHILATKTVADMKVVMQNTPYSGVFDNKYASLEEFEVKLDEFVFENFVDTIKKTNMYDGKYVIDLLNRKIDMNNIMALLKLRIRGVERSKQKRLLVNNKSQLCSRFDKLIKAETLKEFVHGFKGLPYYLSLEKGFVKYEKDGTLVHFESELYRDFKRFVVGNDLSHTLGPYPMFSYLVKKEIELRNMYVISRGIDGKFPLEMTMGMVI